MRGDGKEREGILGLARDLLEGSRGDRELKVSPGQDRRKLLVGLLITGILVASAWAGIVTYQLNLERQADESRLEALFLLTIVASFNRASNSIDLALTAQNTTWIQDAYASVNTASVIWYQAARVNRLPNLATLGFNGSTLWRIEDTLLTVGFRLERDPGLWDEDTPEELYLIRVREPLREVADQIYPFEFGGPAPLDQLDQDEISRIQSAMDELWILSSESI